MERTMLAFVALATLAAGCALPTPYLKGQKEGGESWPKDESAKEYCCRLSKEADSAGQWELGFGIVFSVFSAGGVIAGTAAGPDTSANANWMEKNRNAMIAGASALLAIPAVALLSRSKDASVASSRAAQAIGEHHDVAMRACLAARAEYAASRSGIADLVKDNLQNRLKSIQKQQDETDELAVRLFKEAAKEGRDTPEGKEKVKQAENAKNKAQLLQEIKDRVIKEAIQDLAEEKDTSDGSAGKGNSTRSPSDRP